MTILFKSKLVILLAETFKMRNKTIFLIILLLSITSSFAQNTGDEDFIQDYTPSILIHKGQTEFKLFNNLYTQKNYFNENSDRLSNVNRSSFFTSIMELNYGSSNNFTIGGELWYKSVKIGGVNSSPLNVLTFENNLNARSGIAALGFKIKFNPVKKWTNFSIETTLLANTLSDPESKKRNQPFLDNNRHQWVTKLLYDKAINEKFQLFMQLSSWVSIDKELAKDNMGIAIPLDVFVSYFVTHKFTVYLQNQLWPSIGSSGVDSYFVQEGVGVKYQLFDGFELEGLYTKFMLGKNSGAGQTFNIGIRFLN